MALVSNSFLLLVVRHLLLVAMHLLLVASLLLHQERESFRKKAKPLDTNANPFWFPAYDVAIDRWKRDHLLEGIAFPPI